MNSLLLLFIIGIPLIEIYLFIKIGSAIGAFNTLALIITTALIDDDKYLRFNKIVRVAFSQRRKMLRNTLKSWDIPKGIQKEIGFNRRPETLSIEEFVSMV